MANDFIKAEKVVMTALGLLVREVSLPGLVWRDAAGDFKGVKDDTISIRLPAFVNANKRALRSGAARTKSALHERKVDVTLSTDVYLDVPITDEVLTLDIEDLGAQVLNPMSGGMARTLEDEVATLISGATYDNTVAYTAATDDVYDDVVVPARQLLNQAYVPAAGRVLLVGTEVEGDILTNAKFLDPQRAGSEGLFADGIIRRAGGFDVFVSPAIPANEAYAFHKTAYVLSNRAPVVPAGAPWGASGSFAGFALRTVRVFDPDAVEDRIVMDSWCGTNVVKDEGHWSADPATGGKFVPVTDPANPITGQTPAWKNDTARLVRAIKITRS
jgi:hypothetical protein